MSLGWQKQFLFKTEPECLSALVTQMLLKAKLIDFFGNDKGLEPSPDLNACEILGTVVKEMAETNQQSIGDNASIAILRVCCIYLRNDTKLLVNLFCYSHIILHNLMESEKWLAEALNIEVNEWNSIFMQKWFILKPLHLVLFIYIVKTNLFLTVPWFFAVVWTGHHTKPLA